MNNTEYEGSEANESESNELENSSIVQKLEARVATGRSADILALDLDGTVYTKTQNADGTWTKQGDNSRTSQILTDGNVPLVAISARPDWDENSGSEMASYQLASPDVVVSGAGTVVYWRGADGKLKPDDAYTQMMREQEISYSTSDGEQKKSHYDPTLIKDILETGLQDLISAGYIAAVKVDQNTGTGFTTLDISNLPQEDLQDLIFRIRGVNGLVKGTRVTFSEDLEHLSEKTFSGWMQILPKNSGKGVAMDYVLEKTAKSFNPAQIEQKRLRAHMVGDSSIDIWMLLLGSTNSYEVKQYLLGNATPYSAKRLNRLAGTYIDDPAIREEIVSLVESGQYENSRQKLLDEYRRLGQDPDQAQKKQEIAKSLRQMRVVRSSLPIGGSKNQTKIANLRLISGHGDKGVEQVASQL